MELKRFEKESIAFDFDNDIVNATDMIKKFPKKKMNNFLRQKQTKDFIKVLKNKYSKLDALKSVTVVKQGGTGQGTWMHRILALKFAAWLSPEFELFVFEVFDKHLQRKISEAKEKQRKAEIREGYAWNALDRKDLY